MSLTERPKASSTGRGTQFVVTWMPSGPSENQVQGNNLDCHAFGRAASFAFFFQKRSLASVLSGSILTKMNFYLLKVSFDGAAFQSLCLSGSIRVNRDCATAATHLKQHVKPTFFG